MYLFIMLDHFWIPDFDKAFLTLFCNKQTPTQSFYKQHFYFYKQRQAYKMLKNQANAKQHPQAENFLFEVCLYSWNYTINHNEDHIDTT